MRVILASASPRRREILARIAYPFDVLPTQIDETRRPGETPEAYVRRVADDKARRVSLDHPSSAVLGADTAVVLDGAVLGKPADPSDAAAMLGRLSGRQHEVLTAVGWAVGGEVHQVALSRSRVRFRALGEREIADYVATGEPADKAGAYAIQAGAAAFVAAVEGSVTNVIGLPLEETERLARRLGVAEVPSPLPAQAIELRWRAVRSEIAGLSVARGRQPGDVGIVAVSKGHPAALAAAAVRAGAADLGENYVQEAVAKRGALGDTAALRWHLLGPLQRNKVRAAARAFEVVHTVHRLDVARALALAAEPGRPLACLVQVNVTRDPAKSGVAPEAAAGLIAELERIDGLAVRGLMTIAPAGASDAAAGAVFAELGALLDALRAMGYERLHELSMGMSADYEPAVAAGATWLRLGTAIFGTRPPVQREA